MADKHKTVFPVLATFALVCAMVVPVCAHGRGLPLPQQAPAQGQTSPATPGTGESTLATVTATGSAKFSSEQIAAATGLKVGQMVSRSDFQLAANRLSSTGLFSDVRYRFASEGKNVKVEFQVIDASTLHVSFDNFPWFTDQELTDNIRKSVGLFDGTAPESGSYIDAIGTAIKNQLQALGVQGRVEHRLIRQPTSTAMEVQFRLVGVTLKVGSVNFTDPLAQKDVRVQERLQDLVGKPFSRYSVDIFLAEQVRPIYLSQGYLQVKFGSSEAQFSGNPNLPELSRVTIVVPVHPGVKYKWGGANWSGETVFKTDELNQTIGLSTGQLANGLAIEAGWQKVRQEYGAKGYLDISLDARPSFDDAKATATYNVKITEGQPYRMGKLIISGLSVEAEKRMRAAWLIHPGQTFDHNYYQAFLGDIARKALSGLPVHYEHIGRFLQQNSDHTVDVLLDFR